MFNKTHDHPHGERGFGATQNCFNKYVYVTNGEEPPPLLKHNQPSMQINYRNNKLMLFNPCRSIDFMPKIDLGGQQLEVVRK